mmetsp:Transcript_87922/g.226674  ORF Transcript_87922/g.226674 Transcript_87922/m.226674 type:complete len:216 (+) Transcript_87922:190-837(+)
MGCRLMRKGDKETEGPTAMNSPTSSDRDVWTSTKVLLMKRSCGSLFWCAHVMSTGLSASSRMKESTRNRMECQERRGAFCGGSLVDCGSSCHRGSGGDGENVRANSACPTCPSSMSPSLATEGALAMGAPPCSISRCRASDSFWPSLLARWSVSTPSVLLRLRMLAKSFDCFVDLLSESDWGTVAYTITDMSTSQADSVTGQKSSTLSMKSRGMK